MPTGSLDAGCSRHSRRGFVSLNSRTLWAVEGKDRSCLVHSLPLHALLYARGGVPTERKVLSRTAQGREPRCTNDDGKGEERTGQVTIAEGDVVKWRGQLWSGGRLGCGIN